MTPVAARALGRFVRCALSLCMILCGLVRVARAEDLSCPLPSQVGAPPAAYQTAIRDAVDDHEAGRFLDARAQFRHAHGLYPSARTLRGLGLVEFELRHYVDSLVHLEAALRCQVRPLEGALRDEAEALLARARAYVGELSLQIAPSDAAVELDGKASDARVLRLALGAHTLVVTRDGYLPTRLELSIAGGESRTLQVSLEPNISPANVHEQPRALPAIADTAPRSDLPNTRRRRIAVWTSVAAVLVAGVATSLALTLPRDASEPRGPRRTGNEVTGEVLSTLVRSR